MDGIGVLKMVATTGMRYFIMRMHTTRSISRQLSLNAWTTGERGTALWAPSSLNAGVSSTSRRMIAAGDDDDEAEQERDAPAPAVEGVVWHEVRERKEDRAGEDLAGLHAPEREAGEEAAARAAAFSWTFVLIALQLVSD